MEGRRPGVLSCSAAFELLRSDPRATLIDIRSTMEFLFVGHPHDAIHVPWIDEPEWTMNPNFIADVRKVMLGGATRHDGVGAAPVVLICRSGKRSLDAAKALVENGFSEVFVVDEGFEGELDEQHHRSSRGGWRYHGLPWTQC